MTNIVDARGMVCPIPVVKANQALSQMTEGILEVHVDNPVAVENLKRMALQKGLAVKAEQSEDNHYIVTIPVPGAVDTTMPEITCRDCTGNFVIAVDTDIMGRGNDELGAVLIKGFLFAVSRLDTLPQTILFYNGGAKLTVEGSASLEDLRSLEEQGVEILTCGTCLNYYGLTDQLAVGSVTDMYTIVERLSCAEKVVKP